MKKFMLILFIVAIPLRIFAALDRFPATPEEILQHQLDNSKYGYVRLKINGQHISEESPYVTLGSTARTREVLEPLLVTHIRDTVRRDVNVNDTSLQGKKFRVTYGLWTDVTPVLIGVDEITLTVGSDGKIAIPESMFAVDLQKYSTNRSGIPFFVPNTLRAELTVEDEDGHVLETKTTEEGDFFGISFHSDSDILRISTTLVLEQRRGKLRIWYRDGMEQVFDRFTGQLLQTILPIRIARYGEGILLTVSNPEGSSVVLETATDLLHWELVPSVLAKGIKASNGDVSFTLPREGTVKFFRARVIPSQEQ